MSSTQLTLQSRMSGARGERGIGEMLSCYRNEGSACDIRLHLRTCHGAQRRHDARGQGVHHQHAPFSRSPRRNDDVRLRDVGMPAASSAAHARCPIALWHSAPSRSSRHPGDGASKQPPLLTTTRIRMCGGRRRCGPSARTHQELLLQHLLEPHGVPESSCPAAGRTRNTTYASLCTEAGTAPRGMVIGPLLLGPLTSCVGTGRSAAAG